MHFGKYLESNFQKPLNDLRAKIPFSKVTETSEGRSAERNTAASRAGAGTQHGHSTREQRGAWGNCCKQQTTAPGGGRGCVPRAGHEDAGDASSSRSIPGASAPRGSAPGL